MGSTKNSRDEDEEADECVGDEEPFDESIVFDDSGEPREPFVSVLVRLFARLLGRLLVRLAGESFASDE